MEREKRQRRMDGTQIRGMGCEQPAVHKIPCEIPQIKVCWVARHRWICVAPYYSPTPDCGILFLPDIHFNLTSASPINHPPLFFVLVSPKPSGEQCVCVSCFNNNLFEVDGHGKWGQWQHRNLGNSERFVCDKDSTMLPLSNGETFTYSLQTREFLKWGQH